MKMFAVLWALYSLISLLIRPPIFFFFLRLKVKYCTYSCVAADFTNVPRTCTKDTWVFAVSVHHKGYPDVAGGATPMIPHGLTVHKVIKTWEEAHQQCQKQDTVLASPINLRVLQAMKTAIGNNNTTYFIGTKAAYNTGEFVSVEGIPLENMTVAMLTMFQQLDPWDGDCLAMDRDSIRVVPCSSRLPYMCLETDLSKREPDVSRRDSNGHNMTVNCGHDNNGYKYYSTSEKCFKVHRIALTWENAFWKCFDEGGQLAVIENSNDADNINDLYKFDDYLWIFIGIRYNTASGNWQTVNKTPVADLFNVWNDSNIPTSIGDICGTLDVSLKLDKRRCTEHRYFICEKVPTL